MSHQDHDSFLELFLQNQNRIYGFILTVVFNQEDAQDIFQQTSLTLWRRWPEYDPQRDFVRWAVGIAFNHVRNFRKRKRHDGQQLDYDVLELVVQTRLDDDEWLEMRRQALTRCMKKLPAEQRQMLERCYVGKDTIKVVAQRYGLTANVLYKTLGRIRRVLHECIERAVESETPAMPRTVGGGR